MGVSRPGGMADVLAVRHWSYPDYTRVVVELSRPVETEEVRHLGPDLFGKEIRAPLSRPSGNLGGPGLQMPGFRLEMACSARSGSGKTPCARLDW